MPIIFVLLRMVGGLFVRLIPALLSTVMRALGIAAISFVGMKIAIDHVHNMVKANITGMPSAAMDIIALLKFDVAIEIIFAAFVGRMTLQLLNGSFRRFAAKK